MRECFHHNRLHVANATRDAGVRAKIDQTVREVPGAHLCPSGAPACGLLFVDAEDVATVRAGSCAVVVVFARPDGDLVDAAIRVGARGLLLADDPAEDFRRSVRDLSGDGGWISPRLFPQLLARMRRPAAEPARLPASLTARELQTLRLLVQGRGNAEIAATMCVSVAGVKYHVSNILRKFGCRNRSQLVALLSSAHLSNSAGNWSQG
ncbi:hypothetical protein SUDANB95_03223 [Actinosynnema sp. ALI-1.44]